MVSTTTKINENKINRSFLHATKYINVTMPFLLEYCRVELAFRFFVHTHSLLRELSIIMARGDGGGVEIGGH